jgi:putative ABC transport system permease protein
MNERETPDPARIDREVGEELGLHRDLLLRELRERGLSAEAAEAEAARRLGDLDRHAEACRRIQLQRLRTGRRRLWVTDLGRDAMLGLRELRRAPGYAAAAILTLAVAVGATTVIFSLLWGIALRPLPLGDPERVFVVTEKDRRDGDTLAVSPPNFLDWRERSDVFSALAAIDEGRITLTGDGEPQRLVSAEVSAGFFDAVGVAPVLGRAFTAEEHALDGPASTVVILGHAVWRARFGGDAGIVGRDIVLDGVPTRVAGVMPEGFRIPSSADVFEPLRFDFDVPSSRGAHYLNVIGRLREGVAEEEALGALDLLGRQLSAEYPDKNEHCGIALEPLQNAIAAPVKRPLWMLTAAVAVVLAMAVLNVVGLNLVRGLGKRRELAVRDALGAGRGRLLRQLAAESLVLALLAGALAVVLARLGLALVLQLPVDLPRRAELSLDLPVLVFLLAVSVAAGLIAGVWPALRSMRGTSPEVLRGGRGGSARGGVRARRTLVIVEVAAAVLLLAAAGALVRSFQKVLGNELGFRPQGLLTLQIVLPEARYPADEQQRAFFEELEQSLEELPGVRSVGINPWLPLDPAWTFSFYRVGPDAPPPQDQQSASFGVVNPEYFATLGARLVEGRAFEERDDETAPPVLVVNQTFVRQVFGSESPLGQKVVIGYGNPAGGQIEREVVGVVADMKQYGLTQRPYPAVYVPYRQVPFSAMGLALATDGEELALVPAVRAAVHRLDPALAVERIETMTTAIARSLGPRRFVLQLFGAFAVLSLLLSAIGLYGLMSQVVAQERREIGLRMALGADHSRILRRVVGGGLLLAAVGGLLGVGAAVLAAPPMRSLLYETSARDPLVLVAAPAVLLAVALFGALLPARRAAGTDPGEVLRAE